MSTETTELIKGKVYMVANSDAAKRTYPKLIGKKVVLDRILFKDIVEVRLPNRYVCYTIWARDLQELGATNNDYMYLLEQGSI